MLAGTYIGSGVSTKTFSLPATSGAFARKSMVTPMPKRRCATPEATPKLRAKGAGRAVELFLSRDAVAPAALVRGGELSDRAARRLCDRLVALGALRELTGRDAFRLYGV